MKHALLLISAFFAASIASQAAVDLIGFDGRSNGNATLKQVFFSVDETSSTWGGVVNVNYGVQNQGSTAAGTFKVKLYLSTDTTIDAATDYAFFSSTVSSLPAGSVSYLVGFRQPISLPPVMPPQFGSATTFYIGMIVDADGQVSESNESNNKNAGAFKDLDSGAVTLLDPVADIQVTDDIAPSTDHAMNFGESPNDGAGGASSTRTVSIFNKGTKDLSMTGISLTTGTHFKIDRIVSNIQKLTEPVSFPRVIGMESSETWSVVIRCDPTVTAAVTDTLVIKSNDPDTASVTIALSAVGVPSPEIQITDSTVPATDRIENFGEVNNDSTGKLTASRTLILTNPGTGPLTIQQNGLTLTTGTHFKIVSVTSSKQKAINLSASARTISAGGAEKWSVVVMFDPLVDGDLADALKIASDDADEPVASVSLIGRGRPVGTLTRIGTPVFQATHADGTGKEMSTYDVSFRNDGEVALTFPAKPFRFLSLTHFRVLQVSSSTRGVLSVVKAGQKLAPNKAEIWTVTLAFDPTAVAITAPGGVINADFTYLFNSPLGSATPVSTTIPVTGTALNIPDLAVTDNAGVTTDLTVPFGPVLKGIGGKTLTQTVTLKNKGVAPIIFEENGIRLSGTSSFTIKSITSSAKRPVNLASTNAASRTLLGGQADTWTVTLVFDPADNGNFTSQLQLRSNDPDQPSINLALSGSGVTPSIQLFPELPSGSAPTRFIIAEQPHVVTWQADYPPTTALIDIQRDTDADPSSGKVALLTGGAFSPTGSISWTPTTAMIGQRVHYVSQIRDTGFTSSDYYGGSFAVIAAGSQPSVRSQVTTASQDYAWELDVGGTIFTGTAPLPAMGLNTVSAAVTIDGIPGTWEFTVNRVASLLEAKGYTYDEMQRPKTFTNGNGVRFTYTYDLPGRLIRTEATNGAVIDYIYDAAGRTTSMKDSTGSTFYEWDTLDRMTACIMSLNAKKGDKDDIRLGYLWDKAGRRTGIVYPGGERITYTYDAAGRMLTVLNVTKKLTFSYEYNKTSGQLMALNRPNGIRTTFEYDGSARLTRILHQKGGVLVADYAYTLNAVGNAVTFTTTLPGNVVKKEQYGYDNAGRLIQVIYSDEDGLIEASDKKVDWTYDGNGNRLTQTTTVNSAVTERRTYTYGNENRLLRVVDQAGNELARYTYDAAGNRTQTLTPTETTNYSYDERNLLTKISTGTSTRLIRYNGAGQRVGEIVDGVEFRLVNDVFVDAYELVQRRSMSGAVLASRSLGAGGELVSYGGTVASLPLQDRLGSFRARTSLPLGDVTSIDAYEVFGANTAATTTRGYAGEEHMHGLQFLRARFYDPANGTFLSKDPLGVAAGLNSFNYCGNDPINQIDPKGTEALPPGGKVIGHMDGYVGSLIDSGISAETIINVETVKIALIDGIMDVLNPIPLMESPSYYTGKHIMGDKNSVNYDSDYYFYANTLLDIFDIGKGTVDLFKSARTAITANADYLKSVPSDASNGMRSFIFGEGYDSWLDAGHNLTSFVNLSKVDTKFALDNLDVADNIMGLGSSILNKFGSPGGVLIDKTAQFIGANLSDIRGATFDARTGQLCFLGTENAGATKDVNMDYFFTAVKAVYGSFTPPFVSLDPPVTRLNEWTDFGNGNGVFEPKEWGGFTIRYNPIWSEQDNHVDLRIHASWNGNKYTQTIRLNAHRMDGPITIISGGRYGMRLDHASTTGSFPGVQFDSSDFSPNRVHGSFYLTPTSQDSYWPVFFYNNGTQNFIVESVEVISGKQHRRYGGRLEGTKLGWVLYEADRVMKCLSVGKDNLTGATYNSSTVPVTGYKNMIERIKGGGRGGDIRMWFVPNEMNLKRHIDPVTGRATVIFDKSTVSLLTESFLAGVPATPIANDFASHFTTNYNAFAARSFPVQDPSDPTGATIINVKIFEMLKEAMQAVSLARFFRDNNIPLDMWWMNQWQPPAAYTPKSIATAYNEDTTGGGYIVIYGGVEVQKPNAYIPSTTAKSVADTILNSRPADTAKPTEDLKGSTWTASTSEGNLRAVAASFQAEQQDGNVDFPEQFHAFASPALPLTIDAYYSSSWLGKNHLGPGWRCQRYQLEFSHPSIFDEGRYTTLPKTVAGDTQLRPGEVRLVDLASGASLDFNSSLVWSYGVSNLGHPLNSFSGLTAAGVPAFAPGLRKNGTTLIQHADKTYAATTPAGDTLLFDSEGRLLSVTNRHGHAHTYTFDEVTGRLTSITDGLGQRLTYTYDASARLTNISGPNGVGVNFTFDGSGRLSQVVKLPSSAIIRTYTYNAQNQMQTATDMHGVKRLGSTPDERGRMDQGQDARGNTTDLKFFREAPTKTRTVKSKDPASALGEASVQSDMAGRTLVTTNVYGSTTGFDYANGALAPTAIRLPTAGRPAITVARNILDMPTQIHDPAVTGASPVTITYSPANMPTKVVDQLKRKTLMTYSPTNEVTKVTRYLGSSAVSTTMAYTDGFVSSVSNPLGHKITINRDEMGRTTSVTDPTGVTVSYEYDASGRLARIIDPKLSGPITYTYDNLDRVTSVTTPSGTTTYQYDPVKKWLTKVIDPLSRSIAYTYNNTTGDVTKTSVQLTGGTTLDTAIAYNRVGGIQSITPPGSQAIGFNFDDGGLLMGTYENGNAAPGAPQNVLSNNARNGVPTTQRNHVFTWGAPYSDLPVTAYSYAFDAVPDNTPESTGARATYNNVSIANHTFQVKARDSAGRWGGVSVFNLKVVASLPAGASIAATSASSTLSVASWKRMVFSEAQLANPAISDDLADPDKDSLTNLLEYALGTNPLVPSLESASAAKPGIPAPLMVDGNRALMYRRDRRKTDIRYVTQWSDNLETWHTEGIIEKTTAIEGTSDDEIISSCMEGNGKYMRLQVVRP